MRNERWFISYRVTRKDFLLDMVEYTYGSVVTDITPARWVMVQVLETHILYAEHISLALASELVHCGTGIRTEYYREEDE